MFEGIGKTEIIVVAVVLLIIFGPKKLPEFARGIAEAVREITGAFGGGTKSKKKDEKEPEKKVNA